MKYLFESSIVFLKVHLMTGANLDLMGTIEESKLKEFISKAFIESGEQYRLYNKTKELLSQSGWTEKVQLICQGSVLSLDLIV